MTKINIGTNKKNITNVEIDKPFDEIRFSDILKIVLEKLGKVDGLNIQGWCDITND